MGKYPKSGITVALVLLACLAAWGQHAPKKPARATRVVVVKDFEARVNQYVEQRKKEAGTMPRTEDSAGTLLKAQTAVRKKTQNNSARPKRGDIFTPEIAKYFRRQIAAALKGRRGARIKTSLRHSEPVAGLALNVNEPYPDGVPVQSMPPTLLLQLPKLPRELQYRIVGRNLVLVDDGPNLVVDILPSAIPG